MRGKPGEKTGKTGKIGGKNGGKTGKTGDRRNVFRFFECCQSGRRSGRTPAFLPIPVEAGPQNRKTFRLSPGFRPRVSALGFQPGFYPPYLSRHSFEQKCSTCPSTVRVTLAPVDT